MDNGQTNMLINFEQEPTISQIDMAMNAFMALFQDEKDTTMSNIEGEEGKDFLTA